MSNITKNVPPLRDVHGRVARYLRVSITDRCNLNCVYCSDPTRKEFIPHENILRYEEIMRVTRILYARGTRKLRITGGEPFMRKNCASFLGSLRKEFPDLRLCVTSNGTLLEPHIESLAQVRPESVNISLDSFRAQSFERLTGKNLHHVVIANIDRLLSMNIRVKLNAVGIRGITDVEIDDFIHALRHMPLDIRFIEFMPMGSGTIWSGENFLPNNAVMDLMADKLKLEACATDDADYAGPARMFRVTGALGRLGFISAISNHFCATCNRLRLTSDGLLRTCLFSDREYPLAPLLRAGSVSDREIEKVIEEAYAVKPVGADLLERRCQTEVARKKMSGIGG